jgi:hypothetical protein
MRCSTSGRRGPKREKQPPKRPGNNRLNTAGSVLPVAGHDASLTFTYLDFAGSNPLFLMAA